MREDGDNVVNDNVALQGVTIEEDFLISDYRTSSACGAALVLYTCTKCFQLILESGPRSTPLGSVFNWVEEKRKGKKRREERKMKG